MSLPQNLKPLEWIAHLSPDNCPGGVPRSDQAWRDLVNRIVKDVRAVLAAASDKSDKSDPADPADPSDRSDDGLLPRHGGYRRLRGFQVASLVYDATVIFCDRFISKRSRTHDQMVQAARSGRQNIAEGSMASATSKKTELKLTNVAKASLEELLLDYEDHLRQNGLRQWDKSAPDALDVRHRHRSYPAEWFAADRPDGDLLDPYHTAGANAETAANTILCLIHQAIYLLKRQIAALETAFLEEGGFTERLYRERRKHRRQGRPPG
ncbi:MAG: four helix bundle protein [Akkermansiaceae bacterium]|nr:four helix bundle protein [Akkermansiaceae bacterium]